jgi:anaerobic magnesium-protoporphyrin IX monomethyl ester cyclase
MRTLLLAMPDAVGFLDRVFRAPSLALASMAGNLPGHEAKVLDLVVCKPKIRPVLGETLKTFRPQLVGLSAMTFQFATLLRIAHWIKRTDQSLPIVCGGYHPTLMARDLSDPSLPFDFIVRGEGEVTFRELCDELARPRPDFSAITGLSYRHEGTFRHNPDRPLLDLSAIQLPARDSRLVNGFHVGGIPIDAVETSRGCLHDCSFCSIRQMYGSSYREFPLKRIIADLSAIRARGTRAVFLVDDNITLKVDRFRQICRAITQSGLNDLIYTTQVGAAAIAGHPELVEEMAKANFKLVSVGLESMNPSSLRQVQKPTDPETNARAITLLRQHHIGVNALMIVGFPDDDRRSIRTCFSRLKKARPDSLYSQFLTPYPRTRIREELLQEGLVENAGDFQTYDGFHCNVRTRHLDRDALFRLQRLESLKFILSPQIHAGNFYWQFWKPFIRQIIHTMGLALRGALVGSDRRSKWDI